MAALFLRPDADQSDGSWLNEAASNTNLFASVDESSFSDTDYIQSSSVFGDKVRLGLSNPGVTVSAPLTIRYRANKAGNASSGVIGRLFEGTTQRATWTQALDGTLTTYTYTLTSPEFSSITDFNNLFVEFENASIWWLANASIDLSFMTSQYYDASAGGSGQAVASYLSCTRASVGYAKNADGTLTSFASNTLRIGVGTGLLVEDARTNVRTYSQDFTISAEWNAITNVTVSGDVTAAPDGTTTADKITTTAASGEHAIGGGSSGATGVCTASCYLKNAGYNYGTIVIDVGAGVTQRAVTVNLTTGSFEQFTLAGSPTSTDAAVEALANGWFRVSVTMNCAASASVYVSVYNNTRALGGNNFLGDGTSGIYAWGAQIEIGAFPSSYIPTTSTAASRAAENITTSGSLQTIINAATGSLVAQTDNGGGAGFAANIVDSNGTNLLGFDASNHALASITATLATGNTANRTTQDKLGLAWTASARSLVLNGGTVATDTSSQTPSATQHIGSSGSANFAFAYVERLTAWNTKLANATLQGFTV